MDNKEFKTFKVGDKVALTKEGVEHYKGRMDVPKTLTIVAQKTPQLYVAIGRKKSERFVVKNTYLESK